VKVEINRRPWIKRLAQFPRIFVAHYRITPSFRVAFRLALLTIR
jgi:hypothetical protein